MFFYTPKTTRWNNEVSSAQSKIVSLLKYYQKKSMRDGYKYYVDLKPIPHKKHFRWQPLLIKISRHGNQFAHRVQIQIFQKDDFLIPKKHSRVRM